VASLAPRTDAPIVASGTVPRLDLLLTFDTDSASLTDQGTANAMTFAEALKRPELKQARFELEGHTDATGAHEHNLTLSEQRAQAVKVFLTSHGVEAERLNAVGYASDRLAVPDQPASRANRRVVARRLQ
jgi:outer membrane protein OmpA-like peptidoglycan-associated protein